ncbi:beta-ketoacyl-[acyl-carrier-protein] synthase family protein [Streptomyces sp. RY43-2]|uniref:Beta-ketoacyl-[acyl-carrier-protein] synthase family protein n=1 Tax=Streptomyces macrolidinus TaxID=2952607 RepID=A0ABT0ZJD3_9ACTN|nr:beta-ketoacyl-[acyl-carrier-protein] synthase family protein [Streptomyces macrolidinus]MCN9243703.1 beta-ketoacyl-[acyl-carrier-protein] synthase family protein [Streptomyces macrolidinus]
MRRRRVVVTGAGVVCSLGSTVDDLWQGLLDGRSGIAPVTRFDPARFHSRLAGEVDDAEVTLSPGPYAFEFKRMSAFVRYALFAAERAVEDSGLTGEPCDGPVGEAYSGGSAPRVGPGLPSGGAVYLGVAMGGLPSIEAGVLKQERQGVRKTSPFLIPSLIPNMAASAIALRHGIADEQVTIAGACASGCQAVGEAMRAIRSGDRTWALAGGAEAVTTPITYSGFQAMMALSRDEDPASTPRPFDRRRDGMVVGEGAAVFVLEDGAHAEARGAEVYGELVGYATNSGCDDLTGISTPHVVRCMDGALADAGVAADAVDCVYAQASGMVRGDAAELAAVRELLTGAGRRPVVTSIKGHTGYMFAANGPMNLAAALMALRHQTVSPTLKYEQSDAAFTGVDIAGEARKTELRRCLINAFGFGGINASLVVSRA